MQEVLQRGNQQQGYIPGHGAAIALKVILQFFGDQYFNSLISEPDF